MLRSVNYYDRLGNSAYQRVLLSSDAAMWIPAWTHPHDAWFFRDLEVMAFRGPAEGPYPICKHCGEMVMNPRSHVGFTLKDEEEREFEAWVNGT